VHRRRAAACSDVSLADVTASSTASGKQASMRQSSIKFAFDNSRRAYGHLFADSNADQRSLNV
jgi:hypothetical protein